MERDDGQMPSGGRGSTVRRWGTICWMLVGVVVLAAIAITLVGVLAGLVVPLVVAVVIGTLAVGLVDLLQRWRVPRQIGAVIVMVSIGAVIVGSVVIATVGVVDQSDEISAVVSDGLDRLNDRLAESSIDLGATEDQMDAASDLAGSVLAGVATSLGSVFSGVVSAAFGTFLAVFMLYYVLVDWGPLRTWLGARLGVPPDVGAGVLDDAIGVLRQGFKALTLSSFVTAVLIGAAMVVLDLPLAFTVALITFVTSYVPYLGAIVSGAFGFLVALGAGGPEDALVLLVVILLVQNVVQTVVGNRLTSHSLAIHPLAGLLSTLVGALAFGILGGMLSAPVLAMSVRVSRRLRAHRAPGGRSPDTTTHPDIAVPPSPTSPATTPQVAVSDPPG